MADEQEPKGLDAAYGTPPVGDRKTTGDPEAPPAAATDTLYDLQLIEADARENQARRGADDQDPEESERRRRAYAIWEQEGRPDGRHDDHWHAAGDDAPEPGTAPWTEGP